MAKFAPNGQIVAEVIENLPSEQKITSQLK